MNLQYKNNLLFTSIELNYHSKTITIKDIVLDTGASFCIFEPFILSELGLTITPMDEIETFYGVNGVYNYIRRTADYIALDNFKLTNIDFYIGTVDENINGLLGLDALIKANALIDLNKMKLQIPFI